MSHQHCHARNSLFIACCGCLLALLCSAGCASDSHAAEGAAKGASTGAVAGAVGGLVSGLVFGGDPVERAARGAVYGGTTGAVVGGIQGAEKDNQELAKQQAQRDQQAKELREELGPDAFESLAALAKCKHDEAMEFALKAQEESNPNFALAGVWLEILIYADQKDEVRTRDLLPGLVEKDWNLETEAQAEASLQKALNELMDIREQYGLPRECS